MLRQERVGRILRVWGSDVTGPVSRERILMIRPERPAVLAREDALVHSICHSAFLLARHHSRHAAALEAGAGTGREDGDRRQAEARRVSATATGQSGNLARGENEKEKKKRGRGERLGGVNYYIASNMQHFPNRRGSCIQTVHPA